jgi:hypothetical protein
MTRFTLADEGAHAPDPNDPIWQESQVLLWWDSEQRVGGMQRIGQLPNQGKANYWNGLMAPDGLHYLADVHDLELGGGDRHEGGLRSGGQSMQTRSEGVGALDFDDGDTELHLAYEDFYPMCEVWEHGTGGNVEADMAAAHFETSGRVTGTVRMGDRSYEIDGTFHRDHSWGPREWEALTGHRWVVGTSGRGFSFSSAVMLGTSDLVSGGYVIRDGERIQAREVDVVIGIEPDNVTARTATVAWELENGETVIVDCEAMGGWMFGHGEYIEADQLARFKVRGEDIEGWCDIEVSTNHRLHNLPVRLAVGAALEPGFSQAREPIGLFERLTTA